MSDLLVTAITPTLGSGTGLRTYGVVAALARHGPVEVAYVVWGAPEPAPEYGWLAECHAAGVARRPAVPAGRSSTRWLARAACRATSPGASRRPSPTRRAPHRRASG